MDNLLFAIRRSLFLYFLRRTFSPGVNRTVPLSMLCAHSHSALIRSASAYSSMAFLSFVFFVLFSICRQRTCLFTRPDIVRLTIAPTRHPFYMRLKVDRESAHRSSLPNRQWRGRLQQCVRRLTSRHTMMNSRHHLLCSSPFNKCLHCRLIKVWSSSDKRATWPYICV